MNPNDRTTDIYDKYTATLKNDEVTAAEVEMMVSLLPTQGRVLDLGGGTGRHAIPLAKAGHHITVVDTSAAMLRQLSDKTIADGMQEMVTAHQENALEFNQGQDRYDLITMMWNAFNEIALTEADATILLKMCRESLTSSGKILINIDNIEHFDPSTLKFTTQSASGDYTYIQEWNVESFDPATNTTMSRETIKVQNAEGQNVRQENSAIKQRWWRLDQIRSLSEAYAFNIEIRSLPLNSELYLVLNK